MRRSLWRADEEAPEELENLHEQEFFNLENFRMVMVASCTYEGCSFYARANLSDEIKSDPVWKGRIKEILREELRCNVRREKQAREWEVQRRFQEARALRWSNYYKNLDNEKCNWKREGF